MQNWFETKLRYIKVDESGRERKVTESFLVDAVSFTDAEARITEQAKQFVRGEFQVKDIKESNVTEIISEQDGEWWYKAKISLITIDEQAGREKKVNNYFLVAANDLKDALNQLEAGLSYFLVPYTTTAIALTQICDVFPYFSADKAEAGADQTITKTIES